MNVLVIGAAGKTGSAVVERALAAGHEVTAFVRSATEYKGAGARVVEGDAADPAAMDGAMTGQDAVIDTVGGKTPYKAITLETSIANAVVASMKRKGARRLIVTSMIGEGDSKANTPFYDKLLLHTFLHGATKDKADMEAAVEDSSLDWTILRPAILTDDPAKGDVRVFAAETGEKAHKITRADLAAFMVDQLTSEKHLRRAVTIANS